MFSPLHSNDSVFLWVELFEPFLPQDSGYTSFVLLTLNCVLVSYLSLTGTPPATRSHSIPEKSENVKLVVNVLTMDVMTRRHHSYNLRLKVDVMI